MIEGWTGHGRGWNMLCSRRVKAWERSGGDVTRRLPPVFANDGMVQGEGGILYIED